MKKTTKFMFISLLKNIVQVYFGIIFVSMIESLQFQRIEIVCILFRVVDHTGITLDILTCYFRIRKKYLRIPNTKELLNFLKN